MKCNDNIISKVLLRRENLNFMEDNQHILFIHIPKTAGTSFRIAAEEYYHKDNILYDYSPHFKETSKSVIEMVYENQDYYKLYEYIRKLDNSFFSGHFHANKYNSLYDTLNVVSFVRNPVEQVLSHYNHHKNFNGYDKDFSSFIKEQRFRNIQSKALGDKPIDFYGFLGLTEEYKMSIEMFNALYDTKLKYKHINVKRKNSLNIEEIDDDILKLVVRLNEKDVELYGAVKKQFEERKKLYKKSLPFTYGFIQKITKKQISGIVFQKESNEAIEIDIYKGNNYLETILAKNLRHGQIRHNVPRKGFIGFDYAYNEDDCLSGKLHALVKSTNQKIL